MTDVAPPARLSQRHLAHLAMLLFAALIAGSFTFGAVAVPYLAPAPLTALRFVLASLLMGLFAFGIARQRFAWPRAPWRFGVMGFLTAIYFVTMFVALTMTLPVATSAVYTLVPIMTALTGLLLVGQRSGPPVLLSLLLAGIGAIWVIFRGDVDALLRFDVGAGELVYFVGCVAYAIYTPLLRRYNRGEGALVLSFWTLTGTAACLVLYGLPDILATDWLRLPAVVWWVVLYLAVGSTAICFFLIQFASIHLPAAKV
ncbi:MAG: DMT family transporter, partial [Devosia sp.]